MDKPLAQPADTPCPNCDTPGNDRFCASCGQRRDVHLHSIGHFIGEAAEVLTHADSSLWRTFLPLLAKPGFLTREFLAGRRARYLQPFRLYLIASVAFFLVNGWSGGEQALRDSKPKQGAAPAVVLDGPAAAPAAPAPTAGTQGPAGEAGDLKTFVGPAGCEQSGLKGTRFAGLEPRVRSICESINADGGREFWRNVFHNAGRAMFLFVPLLAAFMKLLYWRPKRWYLEHLLLLLHNHAAIFLSVTLVSLLDMLLPWPTLAGLLNFALALYLWWYVYRSMRVAYGQGRWLTWAKFWVLGLAYVVSASLMLVLTFAYSALTL